ncbi:hypothetical protein DKX38_024021 [Salix brachista]|uniref:PX domain-containing protein n=1 Tax=Salix brachista TaxID=2182728 RepID=A0A5N5JL97_9ROSI|nr:hypothetical protein DKX38_024021 [Salix brachista]
MEQQQSGSPSPRSPSSQPYLLVSVTDPVKLGNGVQAYISYRVITKTNLPEYQGHEKIVIRRYSDFVWLRDRLFDKFKGVFIPPLPEKSAVEKFRFSAEFIEMRRQGLDIFVNRIASHQELQQSEDLRTFLQADEETMERLRSQETGIFKKKPADLMQIFKDVQSKVSDVVLGKEKPVEESNPEYEKLKHYIFELENHLAEAQKHAYRLVKRHREMGQSLSDFGKAAKLLGACEGEILGKAFSDLGNKSEALSVKLQKEAHQLLMNFEEPLKDYVRAVQSIKASLAASLFFILIFLQVVRQEGLRQLCLEKRLFNMKDLFFRCETLQQHDFSDVKQGLARFSKINVLLRNPTVACQKQKTVDMKIERIFFKKKCINIVKYLGGQWRTNHRWRERTAPSGREKFAEDEEDGRERWLLRKNLACYGGWLVGDVATCNNSVVAAASGLSAAWWLVGSAGEGGKGTGGV